MTRFKLFFDGCCAPNNPGGIASYGYVLSDVSGVILEGKGIAAEPGTRLSTNNVAEYTAMIEGLQAAATRVAIGDALEVLGDSQLAVRQVNGEYAVRAEHLIDIHARATAAVYALQKNGVYVTVSWIPREENSHADRLSKEALREFVKKQPEALSKIILPWGKFKGLPFSKAPEYYQRWFWKQTFGGDPAEASKQEGPDLFEKAR